MLIINLFLNVLSLHFPFLASLASFDLAALERGPAEAAEVLDRLRSARAETLWDDAPAALFERSLLDGLRNSGACFGAIACSSLSSASGLAKILPDDSAWNGRLLLF